MRLILGCMAIWPKILHSILILVLLPFTAESINTSGQDTRDTIRWTTRASCPLTEQLLIQDPREWSWVRSSTHLTPPKLNSFRYLIPLSINGRWWTTNRCPLTELEWPSIIIVHWWHNKNEFASQFWYPGSFNNVDKLNLSCLVKSSRPQMS